MTEANSTTSNTEEPKKNHFSALINLAILALAIYYIVQMPTILMVIAGFGAVVMIHEFGHFIAAKSVGIKVDEFAIGMGAVVTGVKKNVNGLKVRVLPSILCDSKMNAKLVFNLPIFGGAEGETEYQIRLLPLGGFVKMLGQDDIGPDQHSEDPRSFGNKAIWQRAIVVSAGVIMNLISGAIAFMVVFAGGVDLPPAIVGATYPGSPAEVAGLVPGDKVLKINNETSPMMSFMDLKLASAFSGKDDKVVFTVEHKDGSVEDMTLVPAMDQKLGLRMLGIEQPVTMTIAPILEEEPIQELAKLGLAAGDTIIEANGKPIEYYGEFIALFKQTTDGVAPESLNIKIKKADGSIAESTIDHQFIASTIFGLDPQVVVDKVSPGSPADIAGMLAGDIIVRAGDQPWPTVSELPAICNNSNGQPVPFTVQRKDSDGNTTEVDLSIKPSRKFSLLNILKMSKSPARIGISMNRELSDTTIANATQWDTSDDKDDSALSLETMPRGSKIVKVNNNDVANWQDILLAMQSCTGGECTLAFIAPGSEDLQEISVTIPNNNEKKWYFAGWIPDYGKLADLPLKTLEVQYKAKTTAESFSMGITATKGFLTQTYMTISGMLSGNVNMKAASGPIGILKMSYTVASTRPVTYYIYMMAMLSVCIAVFNFLPLPILDGGLMVLLILEKIMGRPLSMKAQEAINWVGLALILMLFLSVTYNDLINVLGG